MVPITPFIVIIKGERNILHSMLAFYKENTASQK